MEFYVGKGICLPVINALTARLLISLPPGESFLAALEVNPGKIPRQGWGSGSGISFSRLAEAKGRFIAFKKRVK